MFLFGHSLGGLLTAQLVRQRWHRPGRHGVANPVHLGRGGRPDFLSGIVTVTPIPWQTKVPATTAPTVILTGDKDTIAPPAESIGIYDKLTSASKRSVYDLQNDATETPTSRPTTWHPSRSRASCRTS